MKTQMGTQAMRQTVGFNIRRSRSWTILICLALQCIVQSGCVSAVVFAPVLPISIPLFVYGSANLSRGPQTAKLGLFMSTENPGFDATQNQIPVTEDNCKSMGVTVEDIQNFNDEYDANQVVLSRLQSSLEKVEQILKSKGYVFFHHLQNQVESLNEDPELSQVAQQYGFRDAAHLVSVIQQDELSKADIAQIAESQRVTSETVQILLSIATQIKFQKNEFK